MAALRWLERGLLVTGTIALIWCGALVAELMLAQRSARNALRSLPPIERSLPVPPVENAAREPGPMTAEAGSAIAILAIPRIGLSTAVLHGSDAKTLRRGPGHLENTAYPGHDGNAVIAGHRDTFFRPLRHIRIGDDIFLDASGGRLHYRVTWFRVVNPRDLSVLAPTGEDTLTLITCYPFWVLGHAPDRFVVRASRVDLPGAAPLEARMDAPLELAVPPSLIPPNEPAAALVVAAAGPSDDASLVRHAVGRYLSIHGLQLVTGRGPQVTGQSAFTCDVTFDEDQATADCDSVADPPVGEAPHGRTFALERSHDSWAIRSIVLK